MKGARRIMEELRRARVLVLHPDDEDGALLRDHLRRLGCEVAMAWPVPRHLPEEIDTLFVSVDDAPVEEIAATIEARDLALIAIATYESPTTLKAIYDLNAHGVLSKPLRPLGILTQFTLALYRHRYEAQLSAKVRKLEDTLKGRRLVDRAIRLLIDVQGMEEDAAYRLLRDQATAERVTLISIAEEIVAAYETMARLGLGRGDSRAPKK
ncbi:ANTAR domain-containing response regulator [Acidimangrovimonas sediminis]|uniref:ANTAR domain-containing response regulator n=1 Tax=Acidimangrovimonas sediminis TaxID=2056283 RepID=UPI000C80591E|nr:ANTAR domain-containing protein [Acidimangrovimonas sediminis]